MEDRILFLYTEVMGYTSATLRALIRRGAKVVLVHEDRYKLTPFKLDDHAGMKVYTHSSLQGSDLINLAMDFNPTITFVSGWVDGHYMEVARMLRARGKVVIVGCDNPWRGSIRQILASMACKFGYLKRFFSHCWVAGPEQYEFARNLGFKRQEILFDLYSADTLFFEQLYIDSAHVKTSCYPHRFLFVGRLVPVKGLDLLLTAWRALGEERKDWELRIIGNGVLADSARKQQAVVVKDFMQPEQLSTEITQAGCFVLPSRSEPWGVVAHEFGVAGLPLLLSSEVGAGIRFLVPKYNGYSFEAGCVDDLAAAMKKIVNLPDSHLLQMGSRSHELSRQITSQQAAARLLAVSNRP